MMTNLRDTPGYWISDILGTDFVGRISIQEVDKHQYSGSKNHFLGFGSYFLGTDFVTSWILILLILGY
jgi:hypothetical protein